MNAQTGIIDIRGKAYKSVALRVQEFRADHPDWSLTADVVQRDPECVVMKAAVADEQGRIVATGHAEEYRKASQINRTSALENAETSAIGRALAAAGYGGTEFASANEVVNAIHQQRTGNGGGDNAESQMSPAAEPSTLRDQLEQSVAQEVHHDDTAVQQTKRQNWGGRYPNKTSLHRALIVHHAELERLGIEGTFDDLDAYLTSPEYKDFILQAGEHAPHYLEGPRPDGMPEEFIQTFTMEQKARDEIALRGNVAAEPVA